jgi:hypothetical protein
VRRACRECVTVPKATGAERVGAKRVANNYELKVDPASHNAVLSSRRAKKHVFFRYRNKTDARESRDYVRHLLPQIEGGRPSSSHADPFFALIAMLASSLAATAYLQAAPMSSRVAAAPRADVVRMAANEQQWKAAGLAAALALATGIQSASAGPFTRSEIASLTYDQIKGTGLANTCPRVESASAEPIKLSSGKKCKPPPDPLSAHASPLLFGLGGPRLGRHCDALGRGTPQGRGVMDPAPSPRTTRLWAVVWLSSRRHEVARGGRGQPSWGGAPPRVGPLLASTRLSAAALPLTHLVPSAYPFFASAQTRLTSSALSRRPSRCLRRS